MHLQKKPAMDQGTCLLLGILLLVPWSAGPAIAAENAQQAPHFIHDLDLTKRMETVGTELIQKKITLTRGPLNQQLGRKSCSLVLPRERTVEQKDEQLYDLCRDSVLVVGVQYQCGKCRKDHFSTASGFVIAESGAFATNYHVVNREGMEGVVAMTRDGKVFAVREVLAANKESDVAILQLDGSGFQPLPLSNEAPVGATVYAITHPDSHYYMMTRGMVSRYGIENCKERPCEQYLYITADYAKGSSGGPILNCKGAAVGMVKLTESIYYGEEGHVKTNLQMVLKKCIPAFEITKMIYPRN